MSEEQNNQAENHDQATTTTESAGEAQALPQAAGTQPEAPTTPDAQPASGVAATPAATNAGGESAPPATTLPIPPSGDQSPSKTFKVTAPKSDFNGKRYGLSFENGIAETDDAIAAHCAVSNGCRAETAGGKAAFGSDDPKAIERINAAAKREWNLQ